MPAATSTGGSRSTRPHRGFISTVPPHRGRRAGRVPTQGAGSSYKDPPDRVAEPDDHAIGRSRGGLTTKTHALVDGNGMGLVIALTAGQAYSARGHRAHLRAREITAVIPEPSDQIRHRKNKGSRGGRPIAFDASEYKNRNVVERAFNHNRTGAA